MGTEIELVKDDEYAIMRSNTDVKEMMEENLGGQALTPRDLPEIKVPGAGGLAWEIATSSGSDTVKEIKGIVIRQQRERNYWGAAFGENPGEPPQCHSADAMTGDGDPGGICKDCPLAKYESDGGIGQACREQNRLVLIMEGSLIPTILTLPRTSLWGFKNMGVALINEGKALSHVEVSFKLEKAKSKSGITYSRVVATRSRNLSAEMIAKIREIKKGLFS